MLSVLRSEQIVQIIPATRKTPSTTKMIKLPYNYAKLAFTELKEPQLLNLHSFWLLVVEKGKQSEVFERARKLEEREKVEVSLRIPNATADEMVRILYLYTFPQAQVAISSLKDSFNRDVLDGLHLGDDDTAEEVNPYSSLADIFNNHFSLEEFNALCINPAVKYDEDGLIKKPIQCAPSTEEGYSFTNIFPYVKDIDPNLPEDAVIRSPQWLATHMKKVESVIGEVASRFFKSGQQDGSERYSSWLDFCKERTSWVVLSTTVISDLELKVFSREMDEGHRRDTGILGEKPTSSSSSSSFLSPEEKRKRVREQNLNRQKKFRSSRSLLTDASAEDNDGTINEENSIANAYLASQTKANEWQAAVAEKNSELQIIASEKSIQLQALQIAVNQTIDPELQIKAAKQVASMIKWTI